jgi:hypothetical protein
MAAGISTLWQVIERLVLTDKKRTHEEQRHPYVVSERRLWWVWLAGNFGSITAAAVGR